MKKINAETLKRAAIVNKLNNRRIKIVAKIDLINDLDLEGDKIDAEYEKLLTERDAIDGKIMKMGTPVEMTELVDMTGYSNNAFEWPLDEKTIEYFAVEALLFGFSQAACEKLGVDK